MRVFEIELFEVGREKVSYKKKILAHNDDDAGRQALIGCSSHLLSSEVDLVEIEDGTGVFGVLVGGFRRVGGCKITEKKNG